ncbi:2OG-Fe(II) oxygenase [Nocardioides sp. AE5]|uniref:2OG-Fe(II) oxygenase n=1 Tax=Nocardioides sp. AE5 TaxID=2962573 RepID=UPI0028812CAA|nr:2OG-Fe(II) oxygenase [Nocardioides sp. AE5]MDT0202154.1 2OG-Fe(II) oxygenase [Nocardioides sp. AE5]
MHAIDDLHDVLAHRRWVRRKRPFDHVVASNVFTPEFYRELHQQTTGIVGSPDGLARNMGAYDASSAELRVHRDGPLGIFVSRAWHDMIAGIWGLEATGDVSATLHHHEPGGKSGWPHNDLNPSWFAGPVPGPDEISLVDNAKVDHQRGPEPGSEADARETIRGVALLFYLGNPEWEPGDGGETALYASMSGAAQGPSAAVPPVNNSLVMFECTPFSWHGFLGNRKPRTSVVMWLHRSKKDAVARWGEKSIVHW